MWFLMAMCVHGLEQSSKQDFSLFVPRSFVFLARLSPRMVVVLPEQDGSWS